MKGHGSRHTFYIFQVNLFLCLATHGNNNTVTSLTIRELVAGMFSTTGKEIIERAGVLKHVILVL